MAAEFFQVQSGEQERVQVNVFDRNLSTQWVGIGKSEGAAPSNLSRGHGGAQFEMCRAAIRSQFTVEAADNHLANSEVHNSKCPIAERCSHRAIGLQPEAHLPSHAQARRLQFLKIL